MNAGINGNTGTENSRRRRRKWQAGIFFVPVIEQIYNIGFNCSIDKSAPNYYNLRDPKKRRSFYEGFAL
jgi:hypothetical protein